MIALVLTFLLSAETMSGTVAFVGYTESVSQIYLHDLDQKSTTAIGPAHARGPLRWSPDGAWLACTVESDSGRAVCLIPLNGAAPVYIDHAQPHNQFPRWHHSGNKIAYQSGTFPKTTITAYDLATQQESTWGGDTLGLMRPVWLHQADFIRAQVPEEERETLSLAGTGGLVAVQLEAGEQGWTTQLVAVAQGRTAAFPKRVYAFPDEEHSEWSVEPGPKDQSFVYESNDGGDREIFMANQRNVYDVSNHRTADVNPVWSPDGKWVAFESYRNGHRGIYRAHRDTGRVSTVMESDTENFWSPTWSPDGHAMICVAQEYGPQSLLLLNVENAKRSFFLDVPYVRLEHPAWKP